MEEKQTSKDVSDASAIGGGTGAAAGAAIATGSSFSVLLVAASGAIGAAVGIASYYTYRQFTDGNQ